MKDALLQLADIVRRQGRTKEADEYQARAASIKSETGTTKQDPDLDAIPN
jgi:hypothetical protein